MDEKDNIENKSESKKQEDEGDEDEEDDNENENDDDKGDLEGKDTSYGNVINEDINKKVESEIGENKDFEEKKDENVDQNKENKVDDHEDDSINIDLSKLKARHVISSIFILAILIPFFTGGFGEGATGNVVINQDAIGSSVQIQPSLVVADADDDARIGNADAPVEIIEFSDFQCPFCKSVAPTLKQIVEEYGDKVTIVYRDFPLDSIHPMATPAAIAAECVREQGGDTAFFDYHDKIFDNQQALSDSKLKEWAKELGFTINDCLDSQKYLEEIQKDSADAQAAGGRGTPYFVINGKVLSGAQPFSAFKQIIDAELALI